MLPFIRAQRAAQVAAVRFAAALMFIVSTVLAFAADVTGKWTGQMRTANGEFALEFNFKQNGAILTGSVQGPQGDPSPISDGKVEGDTLSFTVIGDGDFEPGEITLAKGKE